MTLSLVQEAVVEGSKGIDSLLLVDLQTPPHKISSSHTHSLSELQLRTPSSLRQHSVHPVLSERFLAMQHLVANHSQRPYVDLARDCRVVRDESLGWEVPERPDSLGGEGHFGVFAVHGFAYAEVEHFDPAPVEHDVLGFKVVVDHSWALARQVTQHLHQ